MNETVKSLIERRAIRKFKDQQISNEKLDLILKAGEYAPTGMGAQSPVMVVVQDKKTILELAKMNALVMGKEGIDPFYGAPTIVIVLADKTKSTYIEDGSLVMGNLMNAAYSLGVDSCWVHRAKQAFESEAGKELLVKWGVGENYVGIGNCILGYRNCEYPKAKP